MQPTEWVVAPCIRFQARGRKRKTEEPVATEKGLKFKNVADIPAVAPELPAAAGPSEDRTAGTLCLLHPDFPVLRRS